MDIADKVHDVLKGVESALWIGINPEDFDLTIDGLHHALAIRAVTGLVIVAIPFGEVDVVPGGRCRVAGFIGPCGDALQCGARFPVKQLLDFLLCFGCQSLLCNPSHELVSVATPGPGIGRG